MLEKYSWGRVGLLFTNDAYYSQVCLLFIIVSFITYAVALLFLMHLIMMLRRMQQEGKHMCLFYMLCKGRLLKELKLLYGGLICLLFSY